MRNTLIQSHQFSIQFFNYITNNIFQEYLDIFTIIQNINDNLAFLSKITKAYYITLIGSPKLRDMISMLTLIKNASLIISTLKYQSVLFMLSYIKGISWKNPHELFRKFSINMQSLTHTCIGSGVQLNNHHSENISYKINNVVFTISFNSLLLAQLYYVFTLLYNKVIG